MKISLCMIVKDEESVLSRCLDSVKDCVDEIVIADTGSTDRTRNIAERYTDKIFSYPWNDDFAAARNFAFSKAEGDYLLWLDADDYIPPESAAALKAFLPRLDTELPDAVSCPYDLTCGKNDRAVTFYRERLLRRAANPVWAGRVHECIPPSGKTVRFDGFRVRHLRSGKERGARNLRIYQKWAAEERLGGRDLFYYGRELYYNRLYTEATAVLEEMLSGGGWYVNKIEACKILSFCYAERGRQDDALTALSRSFLYGEPRASVLCEIARIYKAQNRLREAAYWYEGALRCRDHAPEGDFEEPSCRDLVPLLELTCVYYALGESDKAVLRHKKAEEMFPEHPSVRYNRAFFQSRNLL